MSTGSNALPRWRTLCTNSKRSYWIPWSYAPTLSEKHNSFLRLLKKKGFKEESMTKVALDAIGTFTTLESNKSRLRNPRSGGSKFGPLACQLDCQHQFCRAGQLDPALE